MKLSALSRAAGELSIAKQATEGAIVSAGEFKRLAPSVMPPSASRHLPRSAGEGPAAELPIAGYASLFWAKDLNDDVVAAGAFAASLARTGPGGVRMLYQHEAGAPIGVWDEIAEDERGLRVSGRILDASPQGRLASALVRAGALDGLSIGFRAVHARKDPAGQPLRVLTQVDLWEVSLVTFPMLPGARLNLRAT